MTSYSTQNPSGDKPAEHLMERLDADQIWCLSPPHLLTNHWGMMQSSDSSRGITAQKRPPVSAGGSQPQLGGSPMQVSSGNQRVFWESECQGLEGTSIDHLVPSVRAGSPRSGHTGTCAGWVLNVSRAGDPTAPLGILSQSSVTPTVRNFLPTFQQNLQYPSLYPLPLVWESNTQPFTIFNSGNVPLKGFLLPPPPHLPPRSRPRPRPRPQPRPRRPAPGGPAVRAAPRWVPPWPRCHARGRGGRRPMGALRSPRITPGAG